MSESLLAPYKSLGIFLDNNPCCLFSAGDKSFLAVSTGNSYKIYKVPDLKVKLLGPHFPHKINTVAAMNENLFISSKNIVYKMKFYHIEQKFTYISKENAKIKTLLLLGDYILASDNYNQIIIWENTQEKPAFSWENGFEIAEILHPMTYLNKILIVGSRNMLLFNIKTLENIYDFSESLEKNYRLQEESKEITTVKHSPSLHVIALGFSNGNISLHNIKTDTILFVFQQKNAVIRLSFSHNEIPLLASSDHEGNINIWDLNDRKLFSQMRKVHNFPITCLEFLTTELILLSGSGQENSIIQWKYDDLADLKFRMIRTRKGLVNSVKKLRFYGEDGLHLIISSYDSQCELRDLSLLNECMSITFSKKPNKEVKKKNYDTENQYQINEVLDFDFSCNRAKEWGTLLTCHVFSSKPCIWSCEDHTIIKKSIKLQENQAQTQENLNFITAVTVSNCGNFGVLGFKNGNISKINLQSGLLQVQFKDQAKGHRTSIISLRVNHYNKLLLSADEEHSLNFWDFFSGRLEHSLQSFATSICKVELSSYSPLFLLVFEDFTIELWDMYKLRRSRHFKGHSKAITETRFTPNNKFIISSSMDQTIKIWDILSGQLINDIILTKPVISFDISFDGEMLASAFLDSKEINLWHIMIGVKPWGNNSVIPLRFQSKINDVSSNCREKFYAPTQENNEINEENKENEEFYQQFCFENKGNEFNFTEISEGRWKPLIYLDLIKEKNKPQIVEKTQAKLPFFLDLEKKDEIKQELKEIVLKDHQDKSRILNQQKEKYMGELANVLEKFLEKQGDIKEVFQYMKTLTPSQLDFELRKNFFADIKKMLKMLGFFEEILNSPEEFDLKQVYFKSFLEVFIFFL